MPLKRTLNLFHKSCSWQFQRHTMHLSKSYANSKLRLVSRTTGSYVETFQSIHCGAFAHPMTQDFSFSARWDKSKKWDFKNHWRLYRKYCSHMEGVSNYNEKLKQVQQLVWHPAPPFLLMLVISWSRQWQFFTPFAWRPFVVFAPSFVWLRRSPDAWEGQNSATYDQTVHLRLNLVQLDREVLILEGDSRRPCWKRISGSATEIVRGEET